MKMRERFPLFHSGDWLVVCDKSGETVRASETVLQWDGLRVAWWHADRRNPQDFVKGRQERIAVRHPMGEPPDDFLDTNEVEHATGAFTNGFSLGFR